MSESFALISRRSILRLASLSPLALIGCTSNATDHGAEIAATCSAGTSCTGTPVDGEKLKRVSQKLWAAFEDGAGGAGKIGSGVFAKAFEMSGSYVICNLASFPDDGDHLDTNACCKMCGEKAAENRKWHQTKITPEHFEKAWCDTKAEMQRRLALAGNIMGSNAPSGGDPRQGLGCG